MTTTPPRPSDERGSEEELRVGLQKLERELELARAYGRRSLREMHRALSEDLRVAERRADVAETRVRKLRRRARRAERELATVRESTTWRVGRLLTAVPSRLRHRG